MESFCCSPINAIAMPDSVNWGHDLENMGSAHGPVCSKISFNNSNIYRGNTVWLLIRHRIIFLHYDLTFIQSKLQVSSNISFTFGKHKTRYGFFK